MRNVLTLKDMKVREAFIKAAIVLAPSYVVAWFTDKMVFVVPTLAAAGFFAAAIDLSGITQRRIDEEGGDVSHNVENALPEMDIDGD